VSRATPDADDGILERPLDEAFDRLVSQGEQRLGRDNVALLVTAVVAGLEVATGVLALLAVKEATGSPLLAGLAFSIGFLALLLGHSELFTEGFLVPVTAVVAKRSAARDLGRLWGGTLLGNLAGGWLMMWLLMHAFPELHRTAVESARHFVDAPLNLRSVCLTIVAGSSITLMTRMQHGTDSMTAKMAAAVAGAFLLAGLQMFHSILDSLLIFGALTGGSAPFGYLDWLRWMSYTTLGNVLGGVGLVTLLRLLRSRERLSVERSKN
jgi:formate/nitrite transporter FocA (FNT family)